MFNRSILADLRKWAASSSRKPLIIRGPRQVGKTTVVDIFSKDFDHYLYLNLDRPGETSYFKRNLSVNDVFQSILLGKNITGIKGRCLLFIDEIQNSPEAISYLRYFHEELSHIHVVAAGSLLEAILDRGHFSFPVGRVEFAYLFPLTFAEFSSALGNSNTSELLSNVPFPDFAYETVLKEFHTYALIGGMPEPVATYAASHDLSAVNRIYQNLMAAFLEDIPKYARNQSQGRIMRHCLESAPRETGKRITFNRFGSSEYKSRDAGESLKTLERAMLLYLLQPSTSVSAPIIPVGGKAPRLQFLDTGMVNALAGLQQEFFRMDTLNSLYKGMLAEHMVGQELIASSCRLLDKPCFWVRESPQANAEVDYLIRYQDIVVPVEVKSGAAGSLRSLHQFIDRCPHDIGVRLHAGPVSVSHCTTLSGKKFRLLNLPYFLAPKIKEHISWMNGV